jgi:hypothetical protein
MSGADADPAFSGAGHPPRASPDGETTLLGAVTGRDNITLDIVRLFLAVIGSVFVGLTLYSVLWNGQRFDGLDFCKGAALLVTGTGAALGLKSRTEPDARPYADPYGSSAYQPPENGGLPPPRAS